MRNQRESLNSMQIACRLFVVFTYISNPANYRTTPWGNVHPHYTIPRQKISPTSTVLQSNLLHVFTLPSFWQHPWSRKDTSDRWVYLQLKQKSRIYTDVIVSEWYIKPLIPESDQHLISPYKITPESNIKVVRIWEMIINWRTSWLLNKFSLSAH